MLVIDSPSFATGTLNCTSLLVRRFNGGEGVGAMPSRGCTNRDPPRGDRAIKTDDHSCLAYSPRASLPGQRALRREKVRSSARSRMSERPKLARGIASRLIASLGTPASMNERRIVANVAASEVEIRISGWLKAGLRVVAFRIVSMLICSFASVAETTRDDASPNLPCLLHTYVDSPWRKMPSPPVDHHRLKKKQVIRLPAKVCGTLQQNLCTRSTYQSNDLAEACKGS